MGDVKASRTNELESKSLLSGGRVDDGMRMRMRMIGKHGYLVYG